MAVMPFTETFISTSAFKFLDTVCDFQGFLSTQSLAGQLIPGGQMACHDCYLWCAAVCILDHYFFVSGNFGRNDFRVGWKRIKIQPSVEFCILDDVTGSIFKGYLIEDVIIGRNGKAFRNILRIPVSKPKIRRGILVRNIFPGCFLHFEGIGSLAFF